MTTAAVRGDGVLLVNGRPAPDGGARALVELRLP
jgi:hypothetical protein